jgi:hypothetical protein
MLMGNIDLGQFIFKSTDTMLPKTHSECMEPLLKLFGHGIIPVDVASGSKRCALAILVPMSSLNCWVPDSRYLVQTFSENGVVELIATEDVAGQDTWELSKARKHVLNDFPKHHLPRIYHIAGSEGAFKTVWATMSLVFIWEILEADDLLGLLQYVESLC